MQGINKIKFIFYNKGAFNIGYTIKSSKHDLYCFIKRLFDKAEQYSNIVKNTKD